MRPLSSMYVLYILWRIPGDFQLPYGMFHTGLFLEPDVWEQ